MRRTLLNSSRRTKKIVVALSDFVSVSIAVIFAILVSGLEFRYLDIEDFFRLAWVPFFSILVFYLLGVYNSVLRYIDFSVIYLLGKSVVITFFLNLIIKYFLNLILSLNLVNSFNAQGTIISLSGWSSGILMTFFLLVSTRLLAHYLFSKRIAEKRVVIYGAGSAGIQLAGALRVSTEMEPVAFLDQNPSLHNTFLGGIKVLHPRKLRKLLISNKVDEVLIAMPSVSKSTLRSLLRTIEEYSIKVRILPGLAELAQGKILVSELKEVEISDLLGRLEVEANEELLNKNIQDKVVLVTGAGGSIGSEISRQVARLRAKEIIILDVNEFSLYAIKKEIESISPKADVKAILANVTNKKRLLDIFRTFEVDTIYHAAAYKHVPLVEENPFEGVFNNILGTQLCAQAAIESGVETFVQISTDKAVRPTNIMGATKRFAEMMLQSLSEDNDRTRISIVRFGNVLGSSGSAIPLFQQQIREGGPVTVTHPEVIRYFMSIPEAAELVIQAGAMGEGGDVFVLDMGEPVKIIELAERLIKLSGMEVKNDTNPEGDIEIIFTGLRPGEKLYEELLIGDNVSTTKHQQIWKAKEDYLTENRLQACVHEMKEAEKTNDIEALKKVFSEAIHGYESNSGIVDIISIKSQESLEE